MNDRDRMENVLDAPSSLLLLSSFLLFEEEKLRVSYESFFRVVVSSPAPLPLPTNLSRRLVAFQFSPVIMDQSFYHIPFRHIHLIVSSFSRCIIFLVSRLFRVRDGEKQKGGITL